MKTATGVLFFVAGVALMFMFKVYIVGPAYKKLPGGGYGELYGPISFCRIPVYAACSVLVIIGLAIIAAFHGR